MKLLFCLMLLQTSFAFSNDQYPRITIPKTLGPPIVIEPEHDKAAEAAFWKKALAELKAQVPVEPVMYPESAQAFVGIFSRYYLLARTPGLTIGQIRYQGGELYKWYNAYLATIAPESRKELEDIEAGFMCEESEWLTQILKPKAADKVIAPPAHTPHK